MGYNRSYKKKGGQNSKMTPVSDVYFVKWSTIAVCDAGGTYAGLYAGPCLTAFLLMPDVPECFFANAGCAGPFFATVGRVGPFFFNAGFNLLNRPSLPDVNFTKQFGNAGCDAGLFFANAECAGPILLYFCLVFCLASSKI